MRKKLIFTLLATALTGASIAFSPKPVRAQDAAGCKCTGLCEEFQNYSYCGNGKCSWYCTANQT